MSLSINNNITALNAWRNLKGSDNKLSSSMEKLSSGLRINRAADDPAGLVISEKMRAQLVGLTAATKNSEKAINMIQTAEAALDQVQKLLDKMRQLALDSANSGVNDDAMLAANQAELDEAISSITRIANYTQFGTKKLLDGSLGSKFTASSAETNFNDHVSASSFTGVTDSGKDGAMTVTVTQLATTTHVSIASGSLAITTGAGVLSNEATFTINGVDFTIASGTAMSSVITTINGRSSDTGVTASATGTYGLRLDATNYGSNYDVVFTSAANELTTAASSPTQTDGVNMQATVTFADGSTSTMNQGTGLNLVDADGNAIVLNEITTGSAGSGLVALVTGSAYSIGSLDVNEATFQIGANESQTVTVSVQSTSALSLGINAQYTDANSVTGNVTTFANIDQLKSGTGGALSGGVFVDGTADQMAQSIGVIDEAIEDISTIRGNLGAIQADNLQPGLESLRVAYENLQAAESTIRDTDMSLEMANFTKNQIMMQAGTAMLAQANQIPSTILKLLQ